MYCLACDRYAVETYLYEYNYQTIRMLSLIGTESQVVTVMHALRTMKPMRYHLNGRPVMLPHGAKFICKMHRFPKFRQCHMVVVDDRKDLLVGNLDESLESFLLSDAIDTPILPQWVLWLKKRLLEESLVKPIQSYGIDAYVARFTSRSTDALVEDGLKSGDLRIGAPKLARIGA